MSSILKYSLRSNQGLQHGPQGPLYKLLAASSTDSAWTAEKLSYSILLCSDKQWKKKVIIYRNNCIIILA